LIEGLDRRRHYLVYWKYLLLCGNLRHLCSSTPYHIEHWLFTYSRRLTYKDLNIGGGKITDLLIAPLSLYKPIYLDKVLGIHLGGIRNPERIAIKHIWYIYRNEFTELAREGYDFKELAMMYAEKLYGTKDLRVVGKKLIEDAVRSLPKYSEDVYGPLPRVLKDYVDKRIREDPEFIEVVGS
ncbi:MAG: hypothetical protein N3G48_02800, partial [Sulfolobales archaeon]|nr:hypothetical protein [Sulfolobales archaeon]